MSEMDRNIQDVSYQEYQRQGSQTACVCQKPQSHIGRHSPPLQALPNHNMALIERVRPQPK